VAEPSRSLAIFAGSERERRPRVSQVVYRNFGVKPNRR
jgi:hypothetical protein